MILSTLPLLLALSQNPAQQEPAPTTPARLDVVELKNGDSLTGVVVAELDGYVELRLEAGAVVGLSRALIQSVRRAAVERPVVAASVRPDDSWFVLHDAVGDSVGWLHACTKVDDQGRITASEEYEFVEGVRRYQVTNLCVADADGAPRSAYFRERISMPSLVAQRLPVPDAAAAADRVLDERIVEATVDGERLRVVRLDGHGRHERQLPWAAGATFPLLARTLARHGATVVGPTTMYDAASEQLVERAVDGTGVRQVVLDGRRQRVVEIAETHAGHRNAEWVDAEMRTIRRELAGPSLVAVPSNGDSVRFAVGAASIPSAVVQETGGTFALWVPNPAWEPVPSTAAGRIGLVNAAHGAHVQLMRIDHLEAGATSSTAADAVARWFALLHPALRLETADAGDVRGRPTCRLVARGRQAGVVIEAVVDVVPTKDAHLALICLAPAAAWDELRADFEFVRRTLELEPKAVQPVLQGPLAERPADPASARGASKVRIP
jgi:hypothetical protein